MKMSNGFVVLRNISRIALARSKLDYIRFLTESYIFDVMTLRELEAIANDLGVPMTCLFDVNLNDRRLENALSLQNCINEIVQLDPIKQNEVIVFLKSYYGVQRYM